MTAFDHFERRLPELLIELSAPQVPDYFEDILSQTARTRQRPGWTSIERWLPVDFAGRAPVAARPFPFRTIGALALIALLLALALAAVGSRQQRLPQPFGPAVNGSFLYDRNGDIYAADPLAPGETALVTGSTTDFAPLWSRDGSKFVFLREADADSLLLMVGEADGSHVRPLTSAPLDAFDWFDWSPDGTQLAIYHQINRRPAISILDADGGGELRTLDLGSVEPMSTPTWRPPSGSELIFEGHFGDVQREQALYAVRPDGSDLRQIAVNPNELYPDLAFQNLSLSADGSRAAFWNWEPGVVAGRDASVHLVDLTTGEDRRMTYDPAAGSELRPVFLPDGTRIAIERQDLDGIAQVLVAPADASTPGVLLGDPFTYLAEHDFGISPDGSAVILAFENQPDRLIDVATGAIEEVTQTLKSLPSWQRRAP